MSSPRLIPLSDDLIEGTAGFSVERTHLHVEYRLRSRSGEPLYVFDAVRHGAEGSGKYDRLLAYVTFEAPATLALKRVVPRLPKYKTVTVSLVPFAHQIEGQQTCRGEIRVASPPSEYNPYFPPEPDSDYETVSVLELRLVLDYMPLAGVAQATPVSELAHLPLFRVQGDSRRLRHLEARSRLDRPLKARRRTGIFEAI